MEEKLRRVYANVAHLEAGPFDVAMDFGFRTGSDEPEYEVRVVMSWPHLKVMVAVLQAQLENYEQQLGALPELVVEPESGDAE